MAFGSLPAVVSLALPEHRLPPAWMVAAGALLGVGAHLLNALPDLADDLETGVRGLPHRLGAHRLRWLAPAVLLAASAVTVFGPAATVGGWAWGRWPSAWPCAASRSPGEVAPFAAAVGIAAVDVVTLVLR